jgi:predicted dehydrogenase
MIGQSAHLSEPVRIAVLGAGYFGRLHAKTYAANPRAKLAYIVDPDEPRARAVAEEFGGQPISGHHALIGKVDAASIAVPTPLHFQVARDMIEAGIHVLVEKPITDSVETALELTELAAAKGVVLQVGHVERFSATFREVAAKITTPLYIESYRIAPWKNRSGDVDVVLDLMIHDIDLIQGLVRSPVVSVHAVGAPIINPTADLANARITFESGCVATVTASRVSYKTERRLRIFQPKSYVIGDFAGSRIDAYSLVGDPATEGFGAIKFDTREIPKEDNLSNEMSEFITCVLTGRKPLVDGRDGCEALRVANMVTDSINEHYDKAQALLASSTAQT